MQGNNSTNSEGFFPSSENIKQAIRYESDLRTLRTFESLGHGLNIDLDGKVSSWEARAEVKRLEREVNRKDGGGQ